MRLITVSELFEVVYGVNLEFNKCTLEANGVNFVSRTSKDNGVVGKVQLITNIEPNPANTISVAGGGSVMESFLQKEVYYSGRDVYFLKPRELLTDLELLYYCACLRANRFKFNFGRQANRSLKSLLIPHPNEMPKWIHDVNSDVFVKISIMLQQLHFA